METLFVTVIATIALIVGILLLTAPRILVKASEVVNRNIVVDDIIFSRRLFFGLLLLVSGLFMINNAWQIF
jgi:hypothetical protein